MNGGKSELVSSPPQKFPGRRRNLSVSDGEFNFQGKEFFKHVQNKFKRGSVAKIEGERREGESQPSRPSIIQGLKKYFTDKFMTKKLTPTDLPPTPEAVAEEHNEEAWPSI